MNWTSFDNIIIDSQNQLPGKYQANTEICPTFPKCKSGQLPGKPGGTVAWHVAGNEAICKNVCAEPAVAEAADRRVNHG